MTVEEELRRTEVRFRALIEKNADAVVLTTADGVISYASPASISLFGLCPHQLIGRSFRDLVHPDDRAIAASTMERLLTDRPMSLASECRVMRSDDTVRWISITGTNLLDDPDVGAIVSNLRDVTERRNSIAALEVERERAESALRATEEQLRQAQKMEAVGRLAGGIAHDFNNVLSVILSYSEMLLEGFPETDERRDDVNEICIAAGRASDLTRQLLMFSRQQVLEPKIMNLNTVLSSMDKMLRCVLGGKISVEAHSDHPLGSIKADPSSIEQVLMNLFVNARDAMPDGGTLTVETANVVIEPKFASRHTGAKTGPYILIAVTDTGSGMSAETQQRIFEPFFTTKPRDKGTGLGLSTVLGIVQQSGGFISVHSVLGGGTSFEIYLPRVDGELGRPQKRDVASTQGIETVLLVEDERQVRAAAKQILQRSGYNVIEAQNGVDAIKRSAEHSGVIHLLLTDVVMPLLNGPELIKRLAPTRPGLRSLCMTGYTDDDSVRHGVLGADLAFLQKPFTPSSLARKVREVLDAPERN